MPVSVALGKGPRLLTHLGGLSPKVQANNVVLIGLRDLDKEEKKRRFLIRACMRSRCRISTCAAWRE